MTRLIVLDDDQVFRKNLCKALTVRGYEVWPSESGEEAVRLASRHSFDAAIIDMKMPGMDGHQVIQALKEIQPSLHGIILTGFGSIADAVKTIKLGGHHYLTKPCNINEIEDVLAGIEAELRHSEPSGSYHGIIGESPGIKEVIRFIRKIKDSSLPVLICGESGTGKELVARAIHYDGARKDRPFIAINCASLKPELLENELFGHVKGAFTGAVDLKEGLLKAADAGTLFIDEVGDMDPVVQASLLRFIETGVLRPLGSSKEVTVDTRIVAAINKDIEEEVRGKRFRHDLYYRLNVCRIDLPPLRNRKEDIVALAQHFLKSALPSGASRRLTDGAMERLAAHNWPGNVRELLHVINRVVLLNKDDILTAGHISEALKARAFAPAKAAPQALDSLDESERKHIASSLDAHGWNISRTARALSIDRRTLQRKMQRYGIRRTAN